LKREDDFEIRRKNIKDLSDEELKERFWELANKVVEPMVDMAREYTSPSIERSVLLRMGFNSLQAKAIVDKCSELNILGKGAGHVVLRLAKEENIPYKEAGEKIAKGELIEKVKEIFKIKV
jgi:D-ornithine 4,5-aminomutase subunit alpha